MADSKIKKVSAYLSIAAAAVLLALGYQLFIVENNFAPAGIGGIATMVQYKTGFSIGYMSLIINIPLCIWAYFRVNKTFAVRSLFFSVVNSLAFLRFQKMGLEAFQYNANGHDTIFPAILSGLISGFVYSVTFKKNASTGGTDIVSKYISKKRPALNFFWVTFVLNAAVAGVSFFVYAKPGADGKLVYNYLPVCLCIVYIFISNYIGNTMIKGTRTACKFTIITSHPAEISEDIEKNLRHGCTQLHGIGSYTQNAKEILICVINPHQTVELRDILSKYSDTFAFSETVSDTYGNFKHIK